MTPVPEIPVPEPSLSVVRGNPSADQIAALVTVLSVLSARRGPAGPPGAGEAKRSEWSARYRLLRAPLHRGPGGWRASAQPH
jgi:hypothetical protein